MWRAAAAAGVGDSSCGCLAHEARLHPQAHMHTLLHCRCHGLCPRAWLPLTAAACPAPAEGTVFPTQEECCSQAFLPDATTCAEPAALPTKGGNTPRKLLSPPLQQVNKVSVQKPAPVGATTTAPRASKDSNKAPKPNKPPKSPKPNPSPKPDSNPSKAPQGRKPPRSPKPLEPPEVELPKPPKLRPPPQSRPPPKPVSSSSPRLSPSPTNKAPKARRPPRPPRAPVTANGRRRNNGN
jgi:hypothetical protein